MNRVRDRKQSLSFIPLYHTHFAGYDLYQAMSHVQTTVAELESLREQAASSDTGSDEFYEAACELAGKIDVTPTMPRNASRQVHRSNAPAKEPQEFYRRNLTLPFLDTIISELQIRYNTGCF